VAPTLGTLILVQAEPFQDRMMPAVGPLTVVLCRATVTFPAPVAVTLSSRPEAGFGTTRHECPVQFSVNALPLRLLPTAQHSETLETLNHKNASK
jgi:hypothetical protein